jgi:diguanylate cyclase (GGDEF)-like protein/PAS domain S-box-containing protein
MDLSLRIDAAWQRMLHLRQQTPEGISVPSELMDAAFQELDVVLEELRTAQEELESQSQDLIELHHRVQQERRRYQDLFDLAPDSYLVLDRQGLIQSANQAIADLLKVPQAALVHEPMVLYIAPDDRPGFYQTFQQFNELAALPKNWQMHLVPRHGSPVVVAVTTTAIETDGVVSWLWQLRDITEQRRLHQRAFYDALTGLPNRALFDDRLPVAMAQTKRRHDQLAVVFLDLDKFKLINDTLGHPIGDAVLRAVGERLQGCLRSQDTIARWGGDEFTLLLPAVESAAAVVNTCDRIVASLEHPIIVNGHSLQVGVSFGIALFPQDSQDPATLLRYADLALYQAKTQACGYRFYHSDLAEGRKG